MSYTRSYLVLFYFTRRCEKASFNFGASLLVTFFFIRCLKLILVHVVVDTGTRDS